jgi:hypothetical protein
MTREIPGGATITLGGTPTAQLGQDDAPIGLKMDLPLGSEAATNAISGWFRGKMAKRPNAKVMIQQREFRFEDGELKELCREDGC